MPSKEELIKALSGAFMTEEEKEASETYKFEEIMISNQRASRLLDIKPTAIRARELSGEMASINSLSKFLLECNTEESRHTDALLRRLCRESEENEVLFNKIYEIAKDVTDRMRGLSSDSPQRLLLVVYTENSLKQLAL